MVSFVWIDDKRAAKLVVTFLGAMTLIGLLLFSISWLAHHYKVNHYERVTGIITENEIFSNPEASTQITYTCQGQEYQTNVIRTSFSVGAKVELICNPKDPTQVSIYHSSSVLSITSLIATCVFAFFAFAYFLNYKVLMKKGVTFVGNRLPDRR